MKFEPRWTSWGSLTGGYNRTTGDTAINASASTLRAYLGTVGADYQFTRESKVGFAVGGTHSNWGQGADGGNGDTLQFAVYGRRSFGAAYVAGWLNASNSWFKSNRLAANGDMIAASYATQGYGGRVEGGSRYAISNWGVTPYAAAQLQFYRRPGYTETDVSGGAQAATYNAANFSDTRSELGLRFDTGTIIGDRAVIFRASAGWAHDWYSSPSITGIFQTLPGSGFTVAGTTPPANSALTTLEAQTLLSRGWAVAAKFDGQFASKSQTYAGTGTLSYKW